jgi:hypothetical protein
MNRFCPKKNEISKWCIDLLLPFGSTITRTGPATYLPSLGFGRQLYDFKSGTRDGKNASIVKPVVMQLTDQDTQGTHLACPLEPV